MNRRLIYTKSTAVFLSVAMIASLSACSAQNTASAQASSVSTKTNASKSTYAEKLFDTSYVHKINISISAEDWSDLKANPTDKTKYQADIEIDGDAVNAVSFSTKGNTSLSSVADDENSDRYSFKVNFGKFVDGQNYYGLDKLNLNNMYADATFMKDYLSYEIFRAAGVDAPLTSYVWLTVNGEDAGLYLAIEDVGESYLERGGETDTALYKPETEQLNNVGNMNKDNMKNPPDFANNGNNGNNTDNTDNSNDKKSHDMPDMDWNNGEKPDFPEMNGYMPNMYDMPDFSKGHGGMPDMMGGNDSGASLKYTDDKIDSYADIFDNAETDVDDNDKKTVISSLKTLSEFLSGGATAEQLESAVDTKAVINYFAAHNFVLNYDSYTGNMLHNYYLSETDGKLSLIPWDYNLAFGAFGGRGMDKSGENTSSSTSTALINTGIDSPLSGAEETDRPMWSWIASNDEYLSIYHQAYDNLLKNYFENGKCDAEIDRVSSMIGEYIEKDEKAFYNADQFDTAVKSLKLFCSLRSQSIRAQLDGTLSATTDKQDASSQTDASQLDIQSMGSQGGHNGKDGQMHDKNTQSSE